MDHTSKEAQLFGQEKIPRILLRIAPPVMLAQLIQALYNIVDSLFVGRQCLGNVHAYLVGTKIEKGLIIDSYITKAKDKQQRI